MSKDLTISQKAVNSIVSTVKRMPVIKKEDYQFLVEHQKHLAAVMENTFQWRTDTQKKSIISDVYFPTAHAKFHQSILEQKVQFDQAMYLAKDFELKKLEVEELECDIEDLGVSRRDDITRRKKLLEIQFKNYELKQMQISMGYRMKEVKGWQAILDSLLKVMNEAGIPEEEIWSKGKGDIIAMFFQSLTNLQGLKTCTDSGERTNLIALAAFSVKQIISANLLESLKKQCTNEQLDSLEYLLGECVLGGNE